MKLFRNHCRISLYTLNLNVDQIEVRSGYSVLSHLFPVPIGSHGLLHGFHDLTATVKQTHPVPVVYFYSIIIVSGAAVSINFMFSSKFACENYQSSALTFHKQMFTRIVNPVCHVMNRASWLIQSRIRKLDIISALHAEVHYKHSIPLQYRHIFTY